MPRGQLDPRGLLLLLEELHLKLQRALHPPRPVPWATGAGHERPGFSLLAQHPPAQVVTWAVKLVPHLCQHLEQVSEFFLTIIRDNDGLRDVTVFSGVPGTPLATAVIQQLLTTLTDLLGWPRFSEAEHRCGLLEAAR